MMTAAAYPATMTELRGEPAHSNLWSNYASSTHLPSRIGSAMDSGYHSSSTVSSQSGRPRSGQTSVDSQAYPYSRYSDDEPSLYDRQPQPAMPSHQNYSGSLKRSFSHTEPAYQEMVQDLRDDGSRLSVNQDHKLLSFRRSQEKNTIVDQHGRVHQLELTAQLHGMFFLSEMPASASDGSVLQPELTCYRRNLFQISGSLVTPRGPLSVVTEANETLPVSNVEVAISAIESVDGNPVRLIVIPWKTPPPNSPEINQGPDQEPAALPLIPFQEEGTETDGEYAVYPIGWRRLQFRIATANNGRRKELQQHFVLHLKVFGTLPDNSRVLMQESTTAPIVVRGRSPRNFQARKEIPLLGSSAGSRGQALVETGLGVVAGALASKQPDGKSRSMDVQVPRSAFTFSPPKLPAGQLSSVRSNSYPTWNSQSNGPMSHIPSSGPGSYPATTMGGADSYAKGPLSGAPGFTSEPQELPLQTSMPPSVPLSLVSSENSQSPMRSHYSYTAAPQLPASTSLSGPESALSVPRYVDNPRALKSPRHHGHQSVHSSGSVSHADPSSEYRYGAYRSANGGPSEIGQSNYSSESSTGASGPSRDYYPSSNTWTTTAGEHSSTAAYASGDGRPYSFSHDQYKGHSSGVAPIKAESSHPASSVYSGGSRGSFDTMNNYSWSGN